jgi:hypothetical protein
MRVAWPGVAVLLELEATALVALAVCPLLFGAALREETGALLVACFAVVVAAMDCLVLLAFVVVARCACGAAAVSSARGVGWCSTTTVVTMSASALKIQGANEREIILLNIREIERWLKFYDLMLNER